MAKKILVLVDGSKNMDRVLNQAVELVQGSNYELSLLHVVTDLEYQEQSFSDIPESVIQEVTKDLETSGQEVLDQAKAKIPAGIPVETFLEIGHPAENSLLFIEANKPDIVVLGGKGHSALERLFLGSVSRYIIDHAPCPVMIVK